ncbi:MAG: sugar phosphate isomerase/epimerase [Nostocoides sp.]
MGRVGRRRASAARADSAPAAIPVALSTASVYPETCAAAFDTAARLGYDGVEVMVWTDPVTQEAGALARLAEHHGIRITSIHAPTLLLTQRVWGTEPWDKIDRSIEVARDVGATTVVLHPPFRWQREYAAGFAEGVALREADTGITLAIENMYPWRARNREIEAYLPDWDPVPMPYAHVTLDLSHTATSGSDALAMVSDLGSRLAHLHLADGSGSIRDEHLVPGHGTQPCAEVLENLAAQGFSGTVVVEVGTRKLDPEQRDSALAESLIFARLHLEARSTDAAPLDEPAHSPRRALPRPLSRTPRGMARS